MGLPNSLATFPAKNRPCLADFASRGTAMLPLLEAARRVAPIDASLLLLGETGVGKERLARAIHAEGPRRKKPFVAVSCVAVPETLLEGEILGYEAGAFTGATHSRRGWFELADGGTLFLDEIGEIPAHYQVKLLQVLQERRFRRIGSEKEIPVDVRIMAATNRDLKADLKAGRFRKDLYYRLSVVTLHLSPLRDRREDIPPLAERYLRHFGQGLGRQAPSLSPEALGALCRYDWPGNVRELVNVLERTILLSPQPRIAWKDLPEPIRDFSAPAGPSRPQESPAREWANLPLREIRRRVVDAAERAYFTELLKATAGHLGKAAARAGISPRALFNQMRRYGLRKEAFRRSPAAKASRAQP